MTTTAAATKPAAAGRIEVDPADMGWTGGRAYPEPDRIRFVFHGSNGLDRRRRCGPLGAAPRRRARARRRRPGARLPDDDPRRRRPRRHSRPARGQRPRRAGHARRHRLGVLQPAHRADRPLPHERAERRVDAVAQRGPPGRRVDHVQLRRGRQHQRRHRPLVPHRADARAEALRSLPPQRPGDPLRRVHAQHRARGVQRRRARSCRSRRSTEPARAGCSPT